MKTCRIGEAFTIWTATSEPKNKTKPTTSVKGLLHEIIPTIPDATTWKHKKHTLLQIWTFLNIWFRTFFSPTYKEAGPEWTGLSDASGGGEGHACEGETQDHGSQAQVAQTQVEEQPGPTGPPTWHSSTAVGPTPRPRGWGYAAGVWRWRHVFCVYDDEEDEEEAGKCSPLKTSCVGRGAAEQRREFGAQLC